jgi:hypothetical protein
MALSAGCDRLEICDVGRALQNADTDAEWPIEMLLRRANQYSKHRRAYPHRAQSRAKYRMKFRRRTA